MRKSMMKGVVAAVALGTVFQLGGCINTALTALWTNLPVYLLTQFAVDNNNVFDVFVDG